MAAGPLQPGATAAYAPDKPAHVMAATGETVSYRELDERARRLARVLRDAGLRPGDHIALLMENHPRFFEVCWAALRSGLYCTPVSTALTADEAGYVVADSSARALIASATLGALAAAVVDRSEAELRLAVGGPLPGCVPYEQRLEIVPADPVEPEVEGSMMPYSSGTTGRPRGVQRPLSGKPAGTSNPLVPFMPHIGLDADSVYLSPAPLYHAAPLGWALTAQRVGATVVVMERFDARALLGLVERYAVTHVQLVPTMLVRLLGLPESERARHDLSSLRKVVHAGAPCPTSVKEAAIGWLGPIVDEYYSGTEGSGITYITAEEWLTHRGSVGKPILGEVHVLGDDGQELPAGEVGAVYFSDGGEYRYHEDPEATARRRDRRGWTTLDDLGYVDEDGYLYLTDRRTHMIVSGGVNVSPREVEDVLHEHPAVGDVAVIGVPHPDLGEEVKAVVQPSQADAGRALADELIALCRARLAGYKCPRSVDFVPALPRTDTGKLLRRALRERYWQGRDSLIV